MSHRDLIAQFGDFLLVGGGGRGEGGEGRLVDNLVSSRWRQEIDIDWKY